MEFDNNTMPMTILSSAGTATCLAKILAATFVPLVFMILLLTVPGIAVPRIRQAALRIALTSLRVFAYGVGYLCIALIIVPVTVLNWVDARWDQISSPSQWFSGTVGGQRGVDDDNVESAYHRSRRRGSMASVISHLDLLTDNIGGREESEDDFDFNRGMYPDSDSSNSSVSSHRLSKTGYSTDADDNSDNDNDKTKTHRAGSEPSSLLLRLGTPMTTRSHSTTTGATTPDTDTVADAEMPTVRGGPTHPGPVDSVDLDNDLRGISTVTEATMGKPATSTHELSKKQGRRNRRGAASGPSRVAAGAATGSEAEYLSSSLA